MEKSIVAVVKVNGDISSSYARLMELLGSMKKIISPFQTVLIKPNWVCDRPYTTGAVTHPELIKACIESVLQCGSSKVYVGDSSLVGSKTELAIENSGLRNNLSKRVNLVDFKKSQYIPVGIPNAHRYRRLAFPLELMESQVVINLPVMKTHDCLPVTLGLKNMKGVLKDTDKMRFHTMGLEEGIIDTNRVALADLTVIDGIIGMEGDGPINGTPVHANLLIGSFDPLAAEVVAIHIMGHENQPLRYIDMAYQANFGARYLEEISIVGEAIENVRLQFKNSSRQIKSNAKGNVTIFQQSACSACRFQMNQFCSHHMKLFDDTDDKFSIYLGGVAEMDVSDKHIKIGIGRCASQEKENFDCIIPGCPPLGVEIKKHIQNVIAHNKSSE